MLIGLLPLRLPPLKNTPTDLHLRSSLAEKHLQNGNPDFSNEGSFKNISDNTLRTKRVFTRETCHPKIHIVFLKTHKTGSSSVLNILYRFGESRNLTFALPVNKQVQLFYPHFFSAHFVEGFSSTRVKDFHIMCNHMRFRKPEVAKVMPKDTFYFSILRHPVSMMESIFVYYKSIPAFRKAHSLENFLNTCWKTYSSSETSNQYAHNVLAFDFGLPNNVDPKDLDQKAGQAIAAIEQDFQLVLISDYFEESMVLLKHSLCWSLEDVVSFRLNSRSVRTRHKVSPETEEQIKRWNALDWRIYLHFNSTFWTKVDRLIGRQKMKAEVSQLKSLQAELASTCLKGGGAVDPSKIEDSDLKPFQYGAAVIQGYNLNPHLDAQTKRKCQRLVTPELQYTHQLYARQFPQDIPPILFWIIQMLTSKL
uniref:Galactose-3-O-sulfotransferase 2 n=1 Tax=Oryzias melastigma TaxID=30732 RepID=A0A3B3CXH6_ORYME